MAGSFAVTVSVVDQATDKIRSINKSFSLLTKPVTQLTHAVGELGKATGLERIGKSLTGIKETAGDIGDKLGGIGSPLALLTGSAGIAGIAAFAYQWARAGEALTITSNRTGITTTNLQLLRGAAERTGISADTATAGLASFGDKLQDMAGGRANEAVIVARTLGVELKKTASGGYDVNSSLGKFADVLSRISNPQLRAKVASIFNLQDLLPLLEKGSAGIGELTDKVRQSGAVMSPQATNDAAHFAESLTGLKQASEGVANSIAEDYIPTLDRATQSLTGWIEKHKTGAKELSPVGTGAAAAGTLAALSRVPLIGAALGAAGLGAGTATGIGVATAAGATAASLMEGNRGLDSNMTLDPEGGLIIMPPAAPRAAPSDGKVTVEIRTAPGLSAVPRWEGSLIDDVNVGPAMTTGN